MNRAVLDRWPIPFEDGAPVRCVVIFRGGEWHTAWGMAGGRRPDAFGGAYPSARAAARASRYINERGASA